MQQLVGRMVVWSLGVVLCGLLPACGASPAGEKALAEGAAFLGRIQRADGAICDTVNPLFDVWETVEAATALWAYRQDTADPVLRKALAFLQANENADGLVCHNQKCQASYCLETSAEYLILLAEIYGKSRIAPRMAVIRQLQKPSGEWEIGNPDVLERKDFPSVTAFVLAAFDAAGMEPAHRGAAVDWLVAQAFESGTWGADWEYYGSSAYPFWVIARALHAVDNPAVQKTLREAEDRAIASQINGEHWEPEDASKAHPSISPALQTALHVSALQYLDGGKSATAVAGGIAYLIQAQRPDGSWDGGLFPIASERYRKEEYVFATARAMVAIGKHYNQRRP